MKPIIRIEHLSKQYRLGTIGTGTLAHDLKRWWTVAIRRKDDPYLKIGEVNDRATPGKSKTVWALRDINLEVMPGEVLGIIGKNGAGKSTLLKIISKVTGPTAGSIHYNGRIGSLLEVGTGFHPELTGRENIFLNGTILGMTKFEIKNKFDEIVEFSGCERYIDTPVKRYSSGMMVRLGFAVAAHLEPEILVIDEVLAVGDAEFQKKAIGKMQDVSRNDGRTVLFVSHNMATVENLCARSILLENGTILADGKTHDIILRYLNNTNLDHEISIADRKDRTGTGSHRIIDFLIKNEDKDEVIRSFDRLNILVKLDKKLIKDSFVRIIIGVYELSSNPLFRIDSENIQIKKKDTYDKIRIKTSEINLVSTTCYINVALLIDGVMSDYIVNVKKLEIIEKKFKDVILHDRNLATILLKSTISFD